MERDLVVSLYSFCFQIMDYSSFLSVLEKNFKDAAASTEENEEPSLQSPGGEGLQMMLEAANSEREGGVLSGFKVTIESVRSFFKNQGWEETRSLSWTDLVALSHMPGVHVQTTNEDGSIEYEANTDLARQFSDLSNKIQQRQLAHEFPYVHPAELQTSDERKAAEQTLSLIEKLNT